MIAPLYPHQQKTRLSASTPPGKRKDFTVDSTRKQANPSVSYESDEYEESDESGGKCSRLKNLKESERCVASATPRAPSSVVKVATQAEAHAAIMEAVARGESSPLSWEWHVAGCLSIQHHGLALEYEPWTEGWTFIRYIKLHPRMRGPLGEWISAEDAFALVDAALRRMGADWDTHLHMSRDDAEASFLDAWDKIKAVPGMHPVDAAMADAAGEQVLFKPGKLKIAADGYLAFLVLCYRLHRRSKDGEVVLPVEGRIPERLGVKPMTISRYRRWALEDGLLIATEAASRHEKRAARFSFVLDRWNEVTE